MRGGGKGCIVTIARLFACWHKRGLGVAESGSEAWAFPLFVWDGNWMIVGRIGGGAEFPWPWIGRGSCDFGSDNETGTLVFGF